MFPSKFCVVTTFVIPSEPGSNCLMRTNFYLVGRKYTVDIVPFTLIHFVTKLPSNVRSGLGGSDHGQTIKNFPGVLESSEAWKSNGSIDNRIIGR